VRRTHATPSDYGKLRISGELDGFCGVRPRLESKGYTCSPRITPPLGFTGTIRYPCDWR
jgi:hypothetical protein